MFFNVQELHKASTAFSSLLGLKLLSLTKWGYWPLLKLAQNLATATRQRLLKATISYEKYILRTGKITDVFLCFGRYIFLPLGLSCQIDVVMAWLTLCTESVRTFERPWEISLQQYWLLQKFPYYSLMSQISTVHRLDFALNRQPWMQ